MHICDLLQEVESMNPTCTIAYQESEGNGSEFPECWGVDCKHHTRWSDIRISHGSSVCLDLNLIKLT